MPRSNRITQAGIMHHVICRGNANQDLFRDDSDFRKYLSLLEEAIASNPLHIYNYVLMSNHLHLLVETKEEGSLSKAMEHVTREYAKYFNSKYNSVGHVFLGRFKSYAVQDEVYYIACSKYIDLIPVKEGSVVNPENYRWSGHAFLAYGKHSELKLNQHKLYSALGNTPSERQLVYKSLVSQKIGPELDLMNRKSGILGDRQFKNKLKGKE